MSVPVVVTRHAAIRASACITRASRLVRNETLIAAAVGVAGNGNSGEASPVHHEDSLWRPSAESQTDKEPHG
jgi:hypothetical protein